MVGGDGGVQYPMDPFEKLVRSLTGMAQPLLLRQADATMPYAYVPLPDVSSAFTAVPHEV